MIPTGNPNILPTIRDAKEIHVLVIKKPEGATDSEEEVFAQKMKKFQSQKKLQMRRAETLKQAMK